ncbi:glycoside hydrolase family 16 protein [Flavobacterium sp. XN-5]|uniref:glycoside hydrolase family 16 protein n=1 Tax=Flavobacterium sp. XN-5 TaxID=2599390 RepID=UPI0013EF0AF0|nr:glycoside hydrolase family 16 protein [Flavobacterium sp. XN-5]NGY37869.1 glycoside hydrolase family 16 protein [Flavobacterium sp. XN-5]
MCYIKNISYVCIVALFSFCSTQESVQEPIIVKPVAKSWKLVYADEFDGTEYDQKYWTSYQTQSWKSAWNYYVVPNDASLAEVKDGNLYLRARWNSNTDLPETGAIQTLNKLSFKYGKLEVRAKFTSSGVGGWPAIWLMPQNPVYSGWPQGGEIDIMERLNNESFVHQVVHQVDGNSNPISTDSKPVINASDYNTYGIIKTPNRIEFYVNNKLISTYEAAGNRKDKWPFETDFYLILNYACADKGQSGKYFWPGNVTSTTNFPYEMAVDYVRIWEEEK